MALSLVITLNVPSLQISKLVGFKRLSSVAITIWYGVMQKPDNFPADAI